MKTIGIVGGMGPLATAVLYQKIVMQTEAQTDQEHPHIIIDANSMIPDRTLAILSGGDDPTPALVDSAKRLEAAGANFLIMACNTAYYYYPSIVEAVGIPMLHMPRETTGEIRRRGIKRVGLLATSGTVQAGIYTDAFSESGIDAVYPDANGQKALMDVVYEGVKAGALQYDVSEFEQCIRRMTDLGAELFVLACTELPIAFERYGITAPNLDPMDVLARAAILEAGYRVKEV